GNRRALSFIAEKDHSRLRKPRSSRLDNNCFCDRRDSRGVKKRKERPPKDSRPKEKRVRHGGRKGRRSARERNRSRRTAPRLHSPTAAPGHHGTFIRSEV